MIWYQAAKRSKNDNRLTDERMRRSTQTMQLLYKSLYIDVIRTSSRRIQNNHGRDSQSATKQSETNRNKTWFVVNRALGRL